MNITNLLNQVNNAFATVNSDNESISMPASNLKEALLKNGMDTLLNLINGSTVTGKIQQIDGQNVVIDLGNNAMINATLNGNVVPKPGEIMSFVVNNKDGNVNLSPLYVNTTPNSNISQALMQASLPDTPQTQYMVKSMMEEGLPIDKSSLLDMNRVVNQYKDIDPKTIATMTRMDIPVNESMIEQFIKYENFEHAITNTINDIGDSLFDSFDAIINNPQMEPQESIAILKDVVNILLPDEAEDTASNQNNIAVDESAENQDNIGLLNNKEIKTDDTIKDKNVLRDTNGLDNDIKQDKPNLKGILDNIIQTKDIKELLKNDSFKDMFKQEISEKWLLKPEEVANENSVNKLYEKLNTQMKQLIETLDKTGNSNTPIAETANSVSNNIDFMNELNHAFSYVQIPLKLANKETAGELYVYTNKKSLAKKDGNVSALLHLDMDNLGPLDVHVSMNENKHVQTKFYLKDDDALDLIANNIDILNERLNKRGYSMNAEFVNKNEDKSIFENIKDANKMNVISQTAFDARA